MPCNHKSCCSPRHECPPSWMINSFQNWQREFLELRQQWSDYCVNEDYTCNNCPKKTVKRCCARNGPPPECCPKSSPACDCCPQRTVHNCCPQSPPCQCCPPKRTKGRFGLAWIAETPEKCIRQPFGWQMEICDTPSNVEARFNEIIEWANSPPVQEWANGECCRNCATAQMEPDCCCKVRDFCISSENNHKDTKSFNRNEISHNGQMSSAHKSNGQTSGQTSGANMTPLVNNRPHENNSFQVVVNADRQSDEKLKINRRNDEIFNESTQNMTNADSGQVSIGPRSNSQGTGSKISAHPVQNEGNYKNNSQSVQLFNENTQNMTYAYSSQVSSGHRPNGSKINAQVNEDRKNNKQNHKILNENPQNISFTGSAQASTGHRPNSQSTGSKISAPVNNRQHENNSFLNEDKQNDEIFNENTRNMTNTDSGQVSIGHRSNSQGTGSKISAYPVQNEENYKNNSQNEQIFNGNTQNMPGNGQMSSGQFEEINEPQPVQNNSLQVILNESETRHTPEINRMRHYSEIQQQTNVDNKKNMRRSF